MTPEPPVHRHRDPAEAKARLRAEMRTARVQMGPQGRAGAAAEVCGLLAGLEELQGDGPFLLYAAFGDELDLAELLEILWERGAHVCLPVVDGHTVRACLVTGTAELVPGWRQVREPPPDAAEVDLTGLRAAVVPGLAFDLDGNRVGYGGGHFDRLLARLPETVPVIGAAFDAQVIDQLPVEPHDRPVHVIVTESRIIRTR